MNPKKIRDYLTYEEIEEYQEAFNSFDQDNLGTISTSEVGSVIRSLGHVISDEEIDFMIREIDIDENKVLDFQEFIGLMSKILKEKDTERELIDAFSTLDTGNLGHITANRMLHLQDSKGKYVFSKQDINRILEVVDSKKEGIIDHRKFINAMIQK